MLPAYYSVENDPTAPPMTTTSQISGAVGGLTYAGVALATTSLPPIAIALGAIASVAIGMETNGHINHYFRVSDGSSFFVADQMSGCGAKITIGTIAAVITSFAISYITSPAIAITSFVATGILLAKLNSVKPFNNELNRILRPICYTSLFLAAVMGGSMALGIALPKAMTIAALPITAAITSSIVTTYVFDFFKHFYPR